ncbi:MAG: hypothetical protein SGJ19_13235 [Planctomycetia bacterium]|nr:hypothetical protein [Planctomycetia bacterium]
MIETAECNTLTTCSRDESLRARYAAAVLAEIPRVIGSLDRNPFRSTYGCFDRQYWHYRTAAFPSEMYQEAVYPLAWAYAADCPGNRWFGHESLREWTVAALRYSARSAHADGSCDDYYPYERALGAAVFSLLASAKAYRLLKLNDAESLAGLVRRARWVAAHQESGRLTNHHALAALALLHVSQITDDRVLRAAAGARVEQVLAWQHPEGWFAEYDGADPGYQTVSIGCLAEYRQLTGRDDLTLSLTRAVNFCRWFLHPDGSYGGEYGSRGTYHCYPHGFELLAGESASAAELADACLEQLEAGRQTYFDDDRLYAHRLVSLCVAYDHWSPSRAMNTSPTRQRGGADIAERVDVSQQCNIASPSLARRASEGYFDSVHDDGNESSACCFFQAAGLFVDRRELSHTIVSSARGGVFKHFAADETPITDGGLVIEFADGRQGVANQHELKGRVWHIDANELTGSWELRVEGQMHSCRWETVTPVKQAVLHLGMLTAGRWCREFVRKLLQRRLIAVQDALPIHFARTIELLSNQAGAKLKVTDRIELKNARHQIKRMAFGVDHQAAYTAAAGVYQDSVLRPWTDLNEYVTELNRARRVTIVREFPA